MVAFLPTLDGLSNPPGPDSESEVPVVNVIGPHGLLIDHPKAQRRLIDFLNEQPYERHRSWDYTLARYAGAAWHTPALKVQLNPAWRTVAGRSTRNYHPTVCL